MIILKQILMYLNMKHLTVANTCLFLFAIALVQLSVLFAPSQVVAQSPISTPAPSEQLATSCAMLIADDQIRRDTELWLNQPLATLDGETQYFNAAWPKDTSKDYPILFLLPGGGWWAPVHRTERFASDTMRAIANQGYVVISMNYRVADLEKRNSNFQSLFPAAVQDVRCALRKFSSDPFPGLPVDVTKVGMLGTSAGGHLALLAASAKVPDEDFFGEMTDISLDHPDCPYNDTDYDLSAVVSAYGPTTLATDELKTISAPLSYFSTARNRTYTSNLHPWYNFLGVEPKDNLVLAQYASPWKHFALLQSAEDVPDLLFVHAKNDPQVPVQRIAQISPTLDKVGVNWQSIILDDPKITDKLAHGFNPFSNFKEYEASKCGILDFFDKKLDPLDGDMANLQLQIDDTDTQPNPPQKNNFACNRVSENKLFSEDVACYGMWDYGNDFGEDANMCGGIRGRLGCEVNAPVCESGKAVARSYIGSSDIRQLTGVPLLNFTSNLGTDVTTFRNGVAGIWEYRCVESVVVNPPLKNNFACNRSAAVASESGKFACYGVWDYGERFGGDVDMCGAYNQGRLGCEVNAPVCESGKAVAEEYYSNRDLKQMNRVLLQTISNNLQANRTTALDGVAGLWKYSCVEPSSSIVVAELPPVNSLYQSLAGVLVQLKSVLGSLLPL